MKRDLNREMVVRNLINNGVDFSKDYFAQPDYELRLIGEAMDELHYRQSPSSKAMGRTRRQAFYYHLQNVVKFMQKNQ